MSATNAGIGYASEQTSISTTTVNNEQVSGGAAQTQAAGSSAQSITLSQGASLVLDQESPMAIAALQATTQNALSYAAQQTSTASMLAGQAIEKALSTAKESLTPADSRAYNMIVGLGLAVAAVAAIYYLSRRG